MKGTDSKMTYQGVRSSAKSWLQGIFSVLVALNVITLISAVVLSNGSGIGLAIIGIAIDGIMLAAIIKEWRVVLNIGRIILIIAIVFGAISIVVGSIAIGAIDSLTAEQKNLLIANEVISSIALICNIFLVVLLGRYTAELDNASYA